MKTLVTGATGFVGSHVAKLLVDAGHEVTILRRANSPLGNVEGLPVRHVIGDLGDEAAIREAVRGQDTVFHVAALYVVWARDAHEFIRTNVEGTQRILRAAADAGARRIVYTSTIGTVRGSARGEVADETSEFNLQSTRDPYVLSKRAAEDAALELARAGAPIVVVNPGGPIGPGDIKPTPTGDMVVKFVNGQLPGYTDGGFSFVDVRDVARGHLLAAERGRAGERYILGGHNLSILEMFQMLGRVTGLKPPPLKIPFGLAFAFAGLLELVAAVIKRPPLMTRANVRILRYYMHVSSQKAERELGYRPGPLEPAIRDAVAWFHARGQLRARRMRRVLQHWNQAQLSA